MRRTMRRLLILVFLLALGSTAHAQAIQAKVCLRPIVGNGGSYVPPCSLDKPLVAGHLLVATLFGGCGSGTCNPVSDSLNNTWQVGLVVPYYNGSVLVYALDVKGGSDTVSFGANGAWLAIITEYPPSAGVDDANYGTYAANNPNGDPQGQSSDWGSTGPVITSQSGDLLIAFGFGGAINECCGVFQPGPGFTIRGVAEGSFVSEDTWTAAPGGPYFGAIQFPGYAHWTLGAVAFKMK